MDIIFYIYFVKELAHIPRVSVPISVLRIRAMIVIAIGPMVAVITTPMSAKMHQINSTQIINLVTLFLTNYQAISHWLTVKFQTPVANVTKYVVYSCVWVKEKLQIIVQYFKLNEVSPQWYVLPPPLLLSLHSILCAMNEQLLKMTCVVNPRQKMKPFLGLKLDLFFQACKLELSFLYWCLSTGI